MARRALHRTPVLLTLLLFGSVLARLAFIDAPCRSPCRSPSDHTLVFDERYYVGAARVIAGIHPPAGQPYAQAPLGVDPNAEHPGLAKLVMAGSIELLGDTPLAWRLGSLICGTLAIAGMFVLVRAAGGRPRWALTAAALMALDNLQLVHGRIATLDVYALAGMVWALAAYLRGRPLAAGALIGVAACAKEVAAWALLVVVLLELLGGADERGDVRRRCGRVGLCVAGAATCFLAALAASGALAPPYDPAREAAVSGGMFGELGHIVSYARAQSSPSGPRGIASLPWQWLGDYRPIVYLNIVPDHPAPGLDHVHPAVHFLGMVSPPILLLALPALALAAIRLWRARSLRLPAVAVPRQLDALSLAWVVGTLAPFELLSLVWSRTSYLYYMVVVMPGMYAAIPALMERLGAPSAAAGGTVGRAPWRWSWRTAWWGLVVLAAVVMYPFTPLP